MPDTAFFSDFGVEIVTHTLDPGRVFVPHMIRYECELRWLEANGSFADRVLHSDAFEVFFREICLPIIFCQARSHLLWNGIAFAPVDGISHGLRAATDLKV
jgi:hypothetical protein